MKKYILSFLTMIISMISFSQEIIEYKGDTVIAITQKDLNTINSIIVESEFIQKELNLLKKSAKVDSVLIATKDSIIFNKNQIIDKKDLYYSDITRNLEISLEREKRRHRVTKYILGGTGVATVVLSLIILCK